MAITAPSKTWEFDANRASGGATDTITNQTQMLNMKNSMISGSLTRPWVVKGSSDSITGAMDGVDRWTVIGDIIANNTLGAAHSWIVLEQPGINFSGAANPLQVLFTMNGNTFASAYVWRSIVISHRDGFAGGTNAADPTATDQWAPMWRQAWLGGGAFASLVQTVAITDDGTITRIIIGTGASAARRWLSFETPRSPVSGWTNPFVYVSKGQGNFAQILAWTNNENDVGGEDNGCRFQSQDKPPVGAADPATQTGLSGYAKQGRAFGAQWMLASNNVLRQAELNVVHDISGEFNTSPFFIFSNTPGHEGIWGELEDFHFIGDGTAVEDSLPGTGEKTWWCLGDIIVPGLNDSATDVQL